MAKKFFYGGQAVIEGVMMRGRRNAVIAVRRPKGDIATLIQPLSTFYTGFIREVPLVRGLFVLLEAVLLGTKALLYSASVSLEEEKEEVGRGLLWGTVAFGFLFALGLFLFLPVLLLRPLDPYLGSPQLSSLIEGIIRLGIFILYLKVINLFSDIRRVFAYHGAEHKTVNAYEEGGPLEVEAVGRYGTAHTRCGTGFVLVVVVIAILAFALLGHPPLWLRFLSRLALLPVIAGLGYEVVRFGAGHFKNSLVRLIFSPTLALQAMTTREPDRGQIEVAITALKGVLEADAVEARLSEEAAAGGDRPNPPPSP